MHRWEYLPSPLPYSNILKLNNDNALPISSFKKIWNKEILSFLPLKILNVAAIHMFSLTGRKTMYPCIKTLHNTPQLCAHF